MPRRRRYNFRENLRLDAELLSAGTIGDDAFGVVLEKYGIDRKEAYCRGLWLRRQSAPYVNKVFEVSQLLVKAAVERIKG